MPQPAPVPPEEAADALHAIEHAAAHSASAHRNRIAAPHLLLWGVIWLVGYTAAYFGVAPELDWLPLVAAGVIASFWLGRRYDEGKARGMGRRYSATIAAVALFIAAIFAILRPQTNNQFAAFFPVMVALWYALLGIWGKGARMLVLGAAVGVLTMTGYFALPQYFLLWMAVVGGGALILGGFWLRRV